MSVKLEVGKKYLDKYGREWCVTNHDTTCDIFTIAHDTCTFIGWVYESCMPDGLISTGNYLVSEVPPAAPAVPTTPQFKVGDRVRVKVPVPQYYTEMYGTIELVDDGRFGVVTSDNFGEWFYPSELEHLTDDTQPTYVPTCTCETFLLMRSGCSCGFARKEIDFEFNSKGWR